MASLCRRISIFSPIISRISSKCVLSPSKSTQFHILQSSVLSSTRRFSSTKPVTKKETVKVTFATPDGKRQTTQAKVGDNLLDVIVDNEIDIDGFGACEGTLACSTCHLIFKPEDFKKIPDKATDEELDMLDLAFALTDTSRLGCQVIVTKDMEGLEIVIPAGVADARDV